MANVIARERMYLTVAKDFLVGEGHKLAATLYAAIGDEIPASAAELFGLVDGMLPSPLPADLAAKAQGAEQAEADRLAAEADAKADAERQAAEEAAARAASDQAAADAAKEDGSGGNKEQTGGDDKGQGAGSPPPLTAIRGIGPVVAQLLIDAGVAGVAELAQAELTKLQSITGLPAGADPAAWIEAAKALIAPADSSSSGQA